MEGLRSIFQLPSPDGLDLLIRVVRECGYTVIGPSVEDGVIRLRPVERAKDLPEGVRDSQEKAFYRLSASGEGRFFGHNLGPQSWKSYLFPASRLLWTMDQGQSAESSDGHDGDAPAYAFLGVRACDLAAIVIQDRVLSGEGRHPHYTCQRKRTLIIGVHCQTAAATCFCPSMGTGPDFPSSGFDLLLTEFPRFFLIQSGSSLGDDILSKLSLSKAPDKAEKMIFDQLATTRKQIARSLPQRNIKEDVYRALDSDYWEEIGQRCLACANCTMVCPTCFCFTLIDKKLMTADGTREKATRTQVWDSCFHVDFTLIHGGSTRVSSGSRYRQWLSHKLATWMDQFGTSGCVGCGRCVTWCPVGIDLTEEMAQLRKKVSPTGCLDHAEKAEES